MSKKNIIAILILTALTIMMLSSCRTTEYVPVEVERVQKEYIHQIDTTILHDSVFVSESTKNDTTYITKFKYQYIYKVNTDTITRVDSIPVVKVVEVPKKYIPGSYKKVFAASIMTILAFVIFILYKIKRMF